MDLRTLASGIGSLSDDTRRELYDYVVGRGEPVSREEAATATGIRAHKANFHLDRLVEEGLLEVEYRRLTGRTGPGAGRPSKLYRRAEQEFSLSLPPRRYDLVGDILAASVTRASAGEPLDGALQESARDRGMETGRAASRHEQASIEDLTTALAGQGYEPSDEAGVVELHNCPFDALAGKHRALVCGLNESYVQGVADGLGCTDADARLEPGEGRCCVRVHRRE
ncbi:helix-turn-helix transcriptional regulator [Janibacter limosus]|jgi:predicted ArsR family transcriptional regulator|uniref:helix-turn-helix transcriptional regulator n=1 Tax=Janibacter limosus TaxID=53458 RepID=UPI00082A392E|nr:helix-turn-helix domain-containing protein [Janibacter limosus]